MFSSGNWDLFSCKQKILLFCPPYLLHSHGRASTLSFCLGKCNRRFPTCISPLFQSESKCEAFYMKISFIHMQILVHLHVNKTNFRVKGFALGLALKQRRNATRKSPIKNGSISPWQRSFFVFLWCIVPFCLPRFTWCLRIWEFYHKQLGAAVHKLRQRETATTFCLSFLEKAAGENQGKLWVRNYFENSYAGWGGVRVTNSKYSVVVVLFSWSDFTSL